jgi:hypothetical protein
MKNCVFWDMMAVYGNSQLFRWYVSAKILGVTIFPPKKETAGFYAELQGDTY